eukprot:3547044-Prymnesium_polylepis.2
MCACTACFGIAAAPSSFLLAAASRSPARATDDERCVGTGGSSASAAAADASVGSPSLFASIRASASACDMASCKIARSASSPATVSTREAAQMCTKLVRGCSRLRCSGMRATGSPPVTNRAMFDAGTFFLKNSANSLLPTRGAPHVTSCTA